MEKKMVEHDFLMEAWGFLLEHVRNGVWLLDSRGQVILANSTLSRWLDNNNLVGTSVFNWVVDQQTLLVQETTSLELKSASGIVRQVERDSKCIKNSKGDTIGFVQVFTDQSTSRALESGLIHEIQRLSVLAGEDQLTRIANRRAFEDALAHVLAEQSKKFGVIVVDLNDFKSINDTFGHSAGDRALAAFAEKLRNLVREGDLVARIGGDEFAILLPSVSMVTLSEAADRLRSNLSVDIEADGKTIRVYASLGYAHSGPNPETVLERADKWMYQHKSVLENWGIAAIAEHEEKLINKKIV